MKSRIETYIEWMRTRASSVSSSNFLRFGVDCSNGMASILVHELFPDAIVIKKYAMSCTFCGNSEDLTDFRGKPVCADCLSKIKELNP